MASQFSRSTAGLLTAVTAAANLGFARPAQAQTAKPEKAPERIAIPDYTPEEQGLISKTIDLMVKFWEGAKAGGELEKALLDTNYRTKLGQNGIAATYGLIFDTNPGGKITTICWADNGKQPGINHDRGSLIEIRAITANDRTNSENGPALAWRIFGDGLDTPGRDGTSRTAMDAKIKKGLASKGDARLSFFDLRKITEMLGSPAKAKAAGIAFKNQILDWRDKVAALAQPRIDHRNRGEVTELVIDEAAVKRAELAAAEEPKEAPKKEPTKEEIIAENAKIVSDIINALLEKEGEKIETRFAELVKEDKIPTLSVVINAQEEPVAVSADIYARNPKMDGVDDGGQITVRIITNDAQENVNAPDFVFKTFQRKGTGTPGDEALTPKAAEGRITSRYVDAPEGSDRSTPVESLKKINAALLGKGKQIGETVAEQWSALSRKFGDLLVPPASRRSKGDKEVYSREITIPRDAKPAPKNETRDTKAEAVKPVSMNPVEPAPMKPGQDAMPPVGTPQGPVIKLPANIPPGSTITLPDGTIIKTPEAKKPAQKPMKRKSAPGKNKGKAEIMMDQASYSPNFPAITGSFALKA